MSDENLIERVKWLFRVGVPLGANLYTDLIAALEAANRPVRALTDQEIDAVFKAQWGTRQGLARNMIAAHIAKQSEPEVRKVKHWTWLLPSGKLLHCSDLLEPQSLPDGSKLLDKFEREVKV